MSQSKLPAMAAVLSISFLAVSTLIVTPALQSLAAEHSGVALSTVLLIATLPNLLAIPTALTAGALAGNRISFRAMLLGATALIALGGVAPYTLSGMTEILIARGAFGLGYGIILALMQSIIIRLYEGDLRARLLGASAVMVSVGGFVVPYIAGQLAAQNLSYVWLMHLVGAVAFVLCLVWLPEPAKVQAPAAGSSSSGGSIPAYGWALICAYGAGAIVVYPLLLGASTVILDEHLGSVASAGLIASAYFAGSFLGGLGFGPLYKRAGKFTLALSFLITAFGMAVAASGHALPMLLLGAGIAGLGFGGCATPAIFTELGEYVLPSAMATACGIAGTAMNLGAFLTSNWMSLAGTVVGNPSPRSAFWASAALALLAIAALAAVRNFAGGAQDRRVAKVQV